MHPRVHLILGWLISLVLSGVLLYATAALCVAYVPAELTDPVVGYLKAIPNLLFYAIISVLSILCIGILVQMINRIVDRKAFEEKVAVPLMVIGGLVGAYGLIMCFGGVWDGPGPTYAQAKRIAENWPIYYWRMFLPGGGLALGGFLIWESSAIRYDQSDAACWFKHYASRWPRIIQWTLGLW